MLLITSCFKDRSVTENGTENPRSFTVPKCYIKTLNYKFSGCMLDCLLLDFSPAHPLGEKGHEYFRQAELRRICFAIIENPQDARFGGRSLQTQMTERFVEIFEIFWLRVSIITSLIWFQAHISVHAGYFDVPVFWFCQTSTLPSNIDFGKRRRGGRGIGGEGERGRGYLLIIPIQILGLMTKILPKLLVKCIIFHIAYQNWAKRIFFQGSLVRFVYFGFLIHLSP